MKACFYLGDLVTCVKDWKICSISGRLPDNPGELAYMIPLKTLSLDNAMPEF